jgi:predicted transcriptional regulator
MATTDNNLRVPDDLLDRARRMAEAEGCTADELAADALKHYIETRQKRDRNMSSQAISI